MANDILENLISKNSDYINAVKSLYDMAGADYINLRKILVETLMKRLNEKAALFNLTFMQDGDLSKAESWFLFHKKHWKHCICFEFSSINYESLNYGICLINSDMDKDSKFNELVIKNFIDFKSDVKGNWVIINDYKEWYDTEWSEFSDDTAANKVFDCVIQLIDKLEKIESIII